MDCTSHRALCFGTRYRPDSISLSKALHLSSKTISGLGLCAALDLKGFHDGGATKHAAPAEISLHGRASTIKGSLSKNVI